MAFQGRYYDIYSDIYSDILPNILSDIYSDILFAILSGILSAISSKILWGRGPAGNTLILSLLFGSCGEHCDLALAFEVRRGTFWSWACCSGPAGNTAIKRVQLRSGREHFAPELAVRVVRALRGTPRSRACSWGPAEEVEEEAEDEAGQLA